jgi:DNA-binding beta-propeller fold protein YncE
LNLRSYSLFSDLVRPPSVGIRIPWLGLAILLQLSGSEVWPLPQAGDSERNFPNLMAPLYEFGRPGSQPGSLEAPSGLAIGSDDLLYVADSGNHRIQIFTMNGMLRGGFGSCGSGPCEFRFPAALAIAADGDIFVTDPGNGRIQEFTPEGKYVRDWNGLRSPRGIAISGDRVYVTDADTHRVHLFSRRGDPPKAFGGLGSEAGHFNGPMGVVVDEEGFIYVADSGNHRIQKLGSEGAPLAEWGAWGAHAGLMSFPTGLDYSKGRLFLADRANHRIQVFDRKGTFLQQWGVPPKWPLEGSGRLHFPESLAVSPSGGLTVVSEPLHHRLQVFVNRDNPPSTRVNDLPWWDTVHSRMHSLRLAPPPPGADPQMPGALAAPDIHAVFFFDVTTSALGPLVTVGGYGRKLGEFSGISGLAVDPVRGRAYVSDPGNRRVVLLELQRDAKRPELFTRSFRIMAAYSMARMVSKPISDYFPELALPGPVSLDGRGRVYLLDRANAAVLVFESDMTFVRLIHVPGSTQDFSVGPDGFLYATDPPHFQVRVFDPEGKERRSWGRRDERAEEGFLMPFGVAVDDLGFVYVTDALLDVVKKFDSRGNLVRRWGGSGPKIELLSSPHAIGYQKPGRIIVEDVGNHRAQVFGVEGEWIGSYVAGGLNTPLSIR